jgi:hypothetical protein
LPSTRSGGQLAALGANSSHRLRPKYQYEQAGVSSRPSSTPAFNLSEAILYGLILLLLGNGSWSASYHVGQRRTLPQEAA